MAIVEKIATLEVRHRGVSRFSINQAKECLILVVESVRHEGTHAYFRIRVVAQNGLEYEWYDYDSPSDITKANLKLAIIDHLINEVDYLPVRNDLDLSGSARSIARPSSMGEGELAGEGDA